ncbi:hypothetical protein CHS0354_040299 [Potamilus streckersoni]|uniref:Uncharacterized protein n=1 Tax=Potamilus streckersoni TaxID=2493646 RepID=A0AAE0SGK6_9BIVA|nr:hypothetical protein CHS0354_040299 [Potamilus streckersoni]
MLRNLKEIKYKNFKERVNRALVCGIISTKYKLCVGVASAMTALEEQKHKSARKHFPRRGVIAVGVDEIWSSDLVDMIHKILKNSGKIREVNFITSRLRVTSNMYSFCTELVILSRSRSLNGSTEFSNIACEKITFDNSKQYLDFLPDLVDHYTHTWHRSLPQIPETTGCIGLIFRSKFKVGHITSEIADKNLLQKRIHSKLDKRKLRYRYFLKLPFPLTTSSRIHLDNQCKGLFTNRYYKKHARMSSELKTSSTKGKKITLQVFRLS